MSILHRAFQKGRRIKYRYVTPSPSGVLPLRQYLYRNTNKYIQLHKRIFLASFQESSTIGKIRFIYSWLLWYAIIGWLRIVKTWSRNKLLIMQNFKQKEGKQLKDLIFLVFILGVQPSNYYRYTLWKFKRTDWPKFLFPQEVPPLHRLFSKNKSAKSFHLLKNKSLFAQEMKRIGMNTIPDKLVFKGEKLDTKLFSNNASYFIKPNKGSGQVDNFVLLYKAYNQSFNLLHKGEVLYDNKKEIISFLNKKLSKIDFLVQPLLANHQLLQTLTKATELITIRLITFNLKNGIVPASAVIEIPLQENKTNYHIVPIEMNSGKIMQTRSDYSKERLKSINFNKVEGFIIPFWEEICKTAINAHQQISDIYSIGWDFAITDEGIVLIEGNFNWNIAPHQRQGPLLIDYFIDENVVENN